MIETNNNTKGEKMFESRIKRTIQIIIIVLFFIFPICFITEVTNKVEASELIDKVSIQTDNNKKNKSIESIIENIEQETKIEQKTETEQETKTVKIGFYLLSGFHEYDLEGNPIGYDVSYLEKIAEYTGWNYEFVDVKDWVEAVQFLEEGKIDLLAPAQFTEERSTKFLFSAYSIGTEYSALMTLPENKELTYEGFTQFNGIKVGCVESFIMNEDFLKYAKKNNFEPNLIFYQNSIEMTQALEQGEVDAILGNLYMAQDNKKILVKFAPSPYYYMANKDNNLLIDELNDALEQLKTLEPFFEEQLNERFYSNISVVPYTAKELEYIKNAPVFYVGFSKQREPLSYIDDQGNAAGIIIELMNKISENSGLKFEYVSLEGENISYQDIVSKKITLVAGVEYTNINRALKGITLSQPFFTSRKVLVGKKGIAFSKKKSFHLAVSTGSQTLEKTIHQLYENFIVKNYKTTEECLDAVNKGEADLVMQSQYAVEKLLAKPKYEKLIIIPSTGLEERLSVAAFLYSDENGKENEVLADKRLISTINKAINRISRSEIDTIIINHTAGIPYVVTVSDFLYQYRFFLILILIVLFCIIGILFYAMRLRIHNNKLIKGSEKRLRTITDNISGGVVVLLPEKECSIQYSNVGFLSMLKITQEKEKNKLQETFFDYVHPNDIKRLKEALEKIQEDGKNIKLELQLKCSDGSYIPVIFRGSLLAEQQYYEIYCVLIDNSEQKKLIESLEQEQERYALILEKMDDIIFDADLKEDSVSLSGRFEEVFGWNESRLSKQIASNFLHIYPDDYSAYEKMEQEIHKGKETVSVQLRLRIKDNSYIWCNITLQCIRKNETLVRVVGKITDIDHQKKEQEKLEIMSKEDGLTNLLNKWAFQKGMQLILEKKAEEYYKNYKVTGCALLFMDIDNFKKLNDTLGHMIGDKALRDTADILRSSFREEDLIGRFGGDEFFVFSNNIPIDVFLKKVKQIVELAKRSYFDNIKENMVEISSSIGVAYSEDGRISYNEMIEQADKALYKAKKDGKNCYRFYQEEEPAD